MSSSEQDPTYFCLTQRGTEATIVSRASGAGNDFPSIVLGTDTAVPRWDTSPTGQITLKCFIDAQTFPSMDSVNVATIAFNQAAAEWASVAFGVVVTSTTVKEVAHFNLTYREVPPTVPSKGSRVMVFARSFMPHQAGKDIVVFQYALDPERQHILKNVFLHELGHVFGLRHEFAIKKEGRGAVRFMDTNEDSVMAYTPVPTIQTSDIEGIRAFYRLKNGEDVDGNGNLVQDYVPQLRGAS